jgi:hypothetical protein
VKWLNGDINHRGGLNGEKEEEEEDDSQVTTYVTNVFFPLPTSSSSLSKFLKNS